MAATTKLQTSVLLYYKYVRPSWTEEETCEMLALQECLTKEHKLCGRVRVACEGLNVNLSGVGSDLDAYEAALVAWRGGFLSPIDFKRAPTTPDLAFRGVKIWRTPELVGLGAAGLPADAPCGRHVSPREFHDLLSHAADAAATPTSPQRKLVLLDARNVYESRLGRFEVNIPAHASAVTTCMPPTTTFSELPAFLDGLASQVPGCSLANTTVAMYCTGGVRCERASAYLLHKHSGVEGLDVVQLSGGIHRYLEAYPDGGAFWRGLNYVFDRREAHGPSGAPGRSLGRCVTCAEPWSSYKGKRRCSKCNLLVLVCDLCQSRGTDKKQHSRLVCEVCGAQEGESNPAEVLQGDADEKADAKPAKRSKIQAKELVGVHHLLGEVTEDNGVQPQ